MTFTLYELAQNQDIQDKVREEINEEYERNNGTIKFESVKAMKYLQAVLKGMHPFIIKNGWIIIYRIGWIIIYWIIIIYIIFNERIHFGIIFQF